MPPVRLPAVRSSAAALLPIPLLALGACSAPATRPLEAAELAASIERRVDTPGELARALELAGLEPLALEAPTPDDLEDPSREGFWHAVAWAWSPRTRGARRALAAARARAGSAGAPGPILAMVEVEDPSEPEMFTRATVSLDMLGLLGLGPSASARALADAETRSALGALEQAVWRTRFEVDAARAQLGASRAALEHLRALRDEALRDRVRIGILAEHGRLGAGALAAAELAGRDLERRLAALEIEESRAAEALAIACGLPPRSAALAGPQGETLDELAAAPPAELPTPEQLLGRLPILRLALLDYAVAEARLRDEATARWPSLRLGPHLLWRESDFLLGALAASGIPWPGSLDGRIAAASEEREAARERTEDVLLAARSRLDGAARRHERALVLLERDARPSALEGARLWTAARARFAVDPAALMQWAEALRMRADTLAGLEQARAALALSTLELAEAAGPPPGATRLALNAQVQP